MKNSNIYGGYRYPTQIISYAVWLYHRFILRFRDIEELLFARGIVVTYETSDSDVKNTVVAMRFFKRLLKGLAGVPLKVMTYKLVSYSAAKKEFISDSCIINGNSPKQFVRKEGLLSLIERMDFSINIKMSK